MVKIGAILLGEVIVNVCEAQPTFDTVNTSLVPIAIPVIGLPEAAIGEPLTVAPVPTT